MAGTYRFLPWVRRGLSAAITRSAAGGGSAVGTAARATVEVTVSVSGGVGDVKASATLLGPGDAVGLDPGQVVSMTPRPGTTDAEPNMLASVEFDAPELPWLFSPAGVDPQDRLAPWLVLVVVEASDKVSIGPAAPLPRLTITEGALAQLPNLDDSWAWAHAQLVDDGKSATTQLIADDLVKHPDRAVSRLICPRRLKERTSWIAAVVPAFDLGVKRGLGQTPSPDAPLGKAWSSSDSVVLPVYHFWEFATGPEGDFESLASRIKPHRASARVGVEPMAIGDAAPPLRVPPDQPQVLDADGALRAIAQTDAALSDVPVALVDGLAAISRTLADAADGVIDGQVLEDSDRQPVGPPVLASAHVRRWQVRKDDAEWFRELNLDPRTRVAAGLGTQVVQENQEDIVNAAWRQVGDVLAVEAALQRAALTTWAAASFHARHISLMESDRLFAFIAPMAARTPLAGISMAEQVRRSSLPDAVLDPGFRRAFGPSGRVVQLAARRLRIATSELRPNVVDGYTNRDITADPSQFARPAISGLSPEAVDRRSTTVVDELGLSVLLPKETLDQLTRVAKEFSHADVAHPDGVTVRVDLTETGVLGETHVNTARRLARTAAHAIAGAVAGGADSDMPTVLGTSAPALLDEIAGAAETSTPGVGMLLTVPAIDPASGATAAKDAVTVDALDVDGGGVLVIRTAPGRANYPLAELDAALSGADLSAALARLPDGSIAAPSARALRATGPAGGLRAARLGTDLPLIEPAPRGEASSIPAGFRMDRLPSPGAPAPAPGVPVVTPAITPTVDTDVAVVGAKLSAIVPPLIKDGGTLDRLREAILEQASTTLLATAVPIATFVAFNVVDAVAEARARTVPAIAQRLRRDALVTLAERPVSEFAATGDQQVDGWWVSHEIDRVMAYPTFPVPAYEMLARSDRTRFCPGIGEIPPESVSLLETNPRFVASFMVGLNQETNRELLWRGYPTDSRGTPFRRFWSRRGGGDDIEPIHGWRLGSLARQTKDPKGSLVLLIRGSLLRKYPYTVVAAVPALSLSEPDPDPAHVVRPIFDGHFDPDVSFFGFPMEESDLTDGEGYFFALMEPITEPRFGLDEIAGARSGPAKSWAEVGWSDTTVAPGAHLTQAGLAGVSGVPIPRTAGEIAEALFQHPYAIYVHAKHLVSPLPEQR
jgi:hypothetical protein